MPGVKRLGEIALRVQDLDRMQASYEGVIGLELMRRFDPEDNLVELVCYDPAVG